MVLLPPVAETTVLIITVPGVDPFTTLAFDSSDITATRAALHELSVFVERDTCSNLLSVTFLLDLAADEVRCSANGEQLDVLFVALRRVPMDQAAAHGIKPQL